MRCTQPGCGGTVRDGYCDTCGLAAAAPSAPSGSAGTASSPFPGSQSSRSRSRRASGRSARGRLGAGLDRRFASAGEMAEQLTGVLREVLAVADGTPRPAFSATFSPEVDVVGLSPDQRITALDWCGSGQPTGNSPILGCEPNTRALRFGLERSYRALARLTPDEDRRIELVDMANAIRPRTLT